MIVYNNSDLHRYAAYTEILDFLGGSEPSDESVWYYAREYNEAPVFENILYEIVLGQIESLTSTRCGISVSYYVNARDTHLYIDGCEVFSLEDYIKYTDN